MTQEDDGWRKFAVVLLLATCACSDQDGHQQPVFASRVLKENLCWQARGLVLLPDQSLALFGPHLCLVTEDGRERLIGDAHELTAADLDGDDAIEFLVKASGSCSPFLRILEDCGSPCAESVWSSPRSWLATLVFDYDRDGDLDLVMADDSCLGVEVNAGNLHSDPQFQWRYLNQVGEVPESPWIGRPEAAFDDLDGDGDVDLVLAGQEKISILINERLDGFGLNTLTFGAGWSHLAVADLDDDCFPDIVAIDRTRVLFFRSRGGMVVGFWSAVALAQVGEVNCLLVDDIDDDGDLDLALGLEGGLCVIRNRRARGFAVEKVIPVGGEIRALVRRGSEVLALVAGERILALKPVGTESGRALTIQLEGRSDNHFGIGAVIEVDAGELRISRMKKESAPIRIGYGHHRLEGLAIRWPQGIRQELLAADIPADGVITIEQN